MSWIFGYRSKPQVPDAGLADADGQTTAGTTSHDQELKKIEKRAMEAYRFDSSALERAAEAAKILEKSSKFM